LYYYIFIGLPLTIYLLNLIKFNFCECSITTKAIFLYFPYLSFGIFIFFKFIYLFLKN